MKILLDSIPSKKNKSIKFDKFEKDPHYIIKMAFKNRNEVTINKVSFDFAHWYMSKVVIEEISKNLIGLFDALWTYIKDIRVRLMIQIREQIILIMFGHISIFRISDQYAKSD